MDFRVSLGGLVVGLLIGLTGMGGGSVMTPMMIFIFHMNPAVAVGTDLVYGSVTKLIGSIQHIKQKTVNFVVVRYLSYGSVPGALIGSLAIGYMQQRMSVKDLNAVIGQMLGAVYILIVLAMMWRWWLSKRPQPLQLTQEPPKMKILLLGLFAGCVVGLTSVGSGSLYIAVLGIIFPMLTAKMVGTDIVQGVIVTGVAGISHLAFGNVNLLMVASLLVGSIPGILIGSRMTVKVPDVVLKVCLMTMLCWSSYSLLIK